MFITPIVDVLRCHIRLQTWNLRDSRLKDMFGKRLFFKKFPATPSGASWMLQI